MSDDVSRLLRETVDEPSRELDGAAVTRRARRQTLAIRAAYGVAGLAMAGAAVATGLGIMADSPAPWVADEPGGKSVAPDEDASCAEVRDGLEEAEEAHSATFGQGPEGREAARTIIAAVEERPDCFDENEIDWARWRREQLAADVDDATVLEQELDEHALWTSVAAAPEDAAAEFLEQVLNWSTEPVVVDESEGQRSEEHPDPSRSVAVEAEGPDGQHVLLRLGRGQPQLSFLGEDVERSADDDWRVRSVITDRGFGLTLDEDLTALQVHHVPEEQRRSVVLLYAGGQSSTHGLADGDVEPGAEADEIELSALGLDDLEHAEVVAEHVEGVWLTALVVHLDDQGHVVGAEGASITEPTSGPEHMD